MGKPSVVRHQEVEQIIRSDPAQSLQAIANKIGVSRERVRQICNELKEIGRIEDRKDLKRAAIRQNKIAIQQSKAEVRKHRKQIWHRMMYVGHRLRLRYAAGLDRHGISLDYHMPGIEVICKFRGCTRSVDARGFCPLHYAKLRMTGALWVRRRSRRTCKEPDCRIPVYARDMCHNHYNSYIRKNPVGKGLKAHNTSGFRGVSWDKHNRRYVAFIHPHDGKQEYLGSFENKEMAARAYDTAARRYFGEKATLNFPDETIEVIKPPKRKADKASGVTGVCWEHRVNRWVVRITQHGKKIYVGRFIDMDQAIAARSAALNAHQP